ncbi:hypothetical protein OAU10_01305 [Saprospiraceae bacterium]|jgi:hypothetical protein|nr:hypothetical protein [Saprospiraceae bacterium]MDC3210114.1 hypothetical protein [Saprospiraceae bacterium]MDG1434540.1 hypothetical protein [Saprospiraceae bacterium]
MKFKYTLIFLLGLIYSCQPSVEVSSGDDAFEKNSVTVMAYLNGYQEESLDYDALYNENAVILNTRIGAEKDSISLAEIKSNDQAGWKLYDYEIMDEISLLPGVNAETKIADGSVRYYGTWRTTKAATDSTEAVQTEIRLYESFDFDEEGKILYQQYYGDLTASDNILEGK